MYYICCYFTPNGRSRLNLQTTAGGLRGRLDGSGLDDIYTLVQSAIGQADESTPEYDTFLGHGQEENN